MGAPRHTNNLAFVVAAAEIVDEHLLDRLVVGDEDVTDRASADEVTDFLRKILSMIAGALERLGHEDNLQARLAVDVLRVLDVAQEDEVAQAIHLGVGAENLDGLADVAIGKSIAAIGQHFFQEGCHLGEVASVFRVYASADRECAVGEAEQEISDALQTDHELHAGEELAGFGWSYLRDGGRDSVVDFEIERVELAFALAKRVEQSIGTGGDAFGGCARGFFGHVTGLDCAANDVVMSRFGIRALDRCTHGYVRRPRIGATSGVPGTVAGTLPFVGSDRQRLSIKSFTHSAVNKL